MELVDQYIAGYACATLLDSYKLEILNDYSFQS